MTSERNQTRSKGIKALMSDQWDRGIRNIQVIKADRGEHKGGEMTAQIRLS